MRNYTIEDYIQAFNDLYITERKKHIQQRQRSKNVDGETIPKGSYSHINRYKLNDSIIKLHLQQKKTIGIFSGVNVTKFITFDIDYKDLDKANQITRELVLLLEEEFYIKSENILVSFSGSKGNHVTLFFDTVLDNVKAREFYNIVINRMGVTTHDIEFRPTATQGVKLPLSINWKTGNRQYFVNPYTLKEVPDHVLFDVKKINTELFIDYLEEFKEDTALEGVKRTDKTLTLEEIEEFTRVIERTNLDIPIDYENKVIEMLEENRLMYSNSRHSSTLLLLTFLNQNGYDEKTAINIVKTLITNTYTNYRDLIDDTRTLEFCLKEVERLYKYAKTYNLGEEAKSSVTIYANEIKEVLIPKRIHLKQLLFVMLVHSKRFARKDGTFFMSYMQMSEYGATDNLGRLVKYVKELEKTGLIEVVARNRKQKNSIQSLPNVYKVNVCHDTTSNSLELTIGTKKELEFEKVVAKLIPTNELKKIVSREQFYKTFKKYYE